MMKFGMGSVSGIIILFFLALGTAFLAMFFGWNDTFDKAVELVELMAKWPVVAAVLGGTGGMMFSTEIRGMLDRIGR